MGSEFAAVPLDFLERVVVTPVAIEFEALTRVLMPPFPGPALRGAIGTALLENWCTARPLCTGDCANPGECLFYERFAREREAPGAGENQPKPWVLSAPPPPGLTAMVSSGVVSPPYAEGPAIPGSFDLVERREPWMIPAGGRLEARMSLIGRHGAWAGELAEALRGRVFEIGLRAGRLAVTGRPSVLPSFRIAAGGRRPEGRLRLELVTPLRLEPRGGWKGTVEDLVRQIATSGMVRAIKVHDAFCRNDGGRLPRIDLPLAEFAVRAHRLWRYWLPRISNKQERAMEIGGIVGSIDLDGGWAGLAPLFRAAEVLHAGQKATFGLGRIRLVEGVA